MHYICVELPQYQTHPHPEPQPKGTPDPTRVKYLKRCFELREFVEIPSIKPEPPGNFPELKLAITVLSIIDYVKPVLKDSELMKRFADVANEFIEKVRADLPKGVSIQHQPEAKAKAA